MYVCLTKKISGQKEEKKEKKKERKKERKKNRKYQNYEISGKY